MIGRVELVQFMYLNVKFNTSEWGIILSIGFPNNNLLEGFLKKIGFEKNSLAQYEMYVLL